VPWADFEVEELARPAIDLDGEGFWFSGHWVRERLDDADSDTVVSGVGRVQIERVAHVHGA
jgi:hypothetical protein